MRQKLHIRNVTLNDIQAISALFRTPITTWQRLDQDGRVQDLTYDALTIYERWLHGGPWMSVETSAIWMNHLLQNSTLLFVAEQDSQVVGYMEAYPGKEPKPYGKHIHIGQLIAEETQDKVIRTALIHHLIDYAAEHNYERITISFSGYDKDAATFYSQFDTQLVNSIGQYSLPAHTGQGFYKVTDHHNADPAQIEGWHLLIGHSESARQQWETLWPHIWSTIPEIRQRRVHRLHVTAAGQNALVFCQQHLYDPRSADIFCWSPQPLKSQMITAICDWAHRQNYRNLVFAVPEAMTKVLGAQVEAYPYRQDIYAINIE